MDRLIILFNLLMCLTAVVTALVVAFVAWPRRHNQTLGWLISLCFASALTMFFYGLQSLALDDLPTLITLIKLEYLGIAALPSVWLALILTFTNPTLAFTRRQIGLLMIVPLVTLLLVFTNEWHGLIWREVSLTTRNGIPVFTPQYGVGFLATAAYSYILITIGTICLIRSERIRWRLYRNQVALLLIGTLLPWLRSALLVFDDANPFAGIAFDALFVAFGLMAIGLTVLRVGLFSFAPFAYQMIFSLLPTGVVLLDRDNYILAVNQEVIDFLGQPREQLEGRHVAELFPELNDWVRQLPSSEETLENLHIHEQTIQVSTLPIRNEGGHIIGTLVQVRDITGEVNREAERQRAEQMARVIRDITQAFAGALNTDHVMERLLATLPRLIDHDAANIMLYDPVKRTARIHYTRGYSAEDDAWLRQQIFPLSNYPTLQTAEATKKPVIVPEVTNFDGWIEPQTTKRIRGYACVPILIDDTVFGFINLDVFRKGALSPEIANRLELAAQQTSTALHNAQIYEQAQRQAAELKRRVDSLEILQKMACDISAIVDRQELASIGLDAMLRTAQTRGGCIALMQNERLQVSACYGNYNSEALETFLNDPQGLRAQLDQIQQIHVEQGAQLSSAMSDSQLRITLPLRRIDEHSTYLLGVILMEDDKPTLPVSDRLEMLVVLADRLSVAIQNASLIDQLSKRAAQLEHLNAQLEELEELKSEMLRVAAHDLKTPLNVVLNYTHLLPELIRSGQNLDDVYRDIREAGKRMDRIISDFLSLERISRLSTQTTTQVFAVHTLFDKLQVDYFMLAHRHKLTIETHIESPPLHGVGDPVLVYEALSNLVSNAVKYTQAGGHIDVAAAVVDGRLRFSVTDNGPGIPPNEHPNLFTPFYRTQSARESSVEGTGIGLH